MITGSIAVFSAVFLMFSTFLLDRSR